MPLAERRSTMRSRLALVAIGVCALFAVGAVAPSIVSAQNKCAGTKRKEAGKKAARKLKCWAKGVKKGLQADPNCLSKATLKFSSSWDKAEAKGGCATTNDKATIEGKVDAFVLDVVAEIPGAGTTTTTNTTTTGSSSTTTSLPAGTCCSAGEIRTQS